MRWRESLKRGAKLLLMNTWTVPINAASQGHWRGPWLWLHIKEQHCLNNTSHRAAFFLCSCPPQAMPTNVASWCTQSQKWSDQVCKNFFFRFLFYPPRSAPWNILPDSCINSWFWQSTGREVGWASDSKEGDPGLFKLSLPSEKCSKNHSPSCRSPNTQVQIDRCFQCIWRTCTKLGGHGK